MMETFSVGLLVLAAALAFWWVATTKQRHQRILERAAKEAKEQEDARKAAGRAEYERNYQIWQEAEREASLECTTSLLLHPGEIVGYANVAQRIATHKLGHKSDRVSSSQGTNDGQTHFSSTGTSNRLSVSDHGLGMGTSQRDRAGGTRRVTAHSTSGSGHSYSQDDIRTEVVDRGNLVLTNRRFVFQGDNTTIEVPIEKVVGFHFNDDDHLVIDYAKRPTGECFVIPNTLAMKMAMSNRLHEPGFEVPTKPAMSV